MTQTPQLPQIKIPFAIKCDNFEFSSRFTKKDITEYFLRIINFNIDTLDFNDPVMMSSFKSMMTTQLLINLSLKNLQAFTEIKKLKDLAPKSFKARFDEVQFTYESDAIQIKNIKMGFSDSESKTLASHIVDGEISVLEKYWNIREAAIISYSDVIKEMIEQDYLTLWCSVHQKDYHRAKKILGIFEQISVSSFKTGYLSSYEPDPAQAKINNFIKDFHEMMKERFTNLKIEKNPFLARMSTYAYTLGVNDDVTNITMIAIEKNYPSMWAQIEKLRIKGIVEVKTQTEGDKSSGKKYKI